MSVDKKDKKFDAHWKSSSYWLIYTWKRNNVSVNPFVLSFVFRPGHAIYCIYTQTHILLPTHTLLTKTRTNTRTHTHINTKNLLTHFLFLFSLSYFYLFLLLAILFFPVKRLFYGDLRVDYSPGQERRRVFICKYILEKQEGYKAGG